MARRTEMTRGRLGIVAVVLIAGTALAVSRSTASDLSEVMAELGDEPTACEELADALRAGDPTTGEAVLDAGATSVLLPVGSLGRVEGYTCADRGPAAMTSFGVLLSADDGETAVILFTPTGRSEAAATEERRIRADDRADPAPLIEVVDDTTVWVGHDGRSAWEWGIDWASPRASATEVLDRVAGAIVDTDR